MLRRWSLGGTTVWSGRIMGAWDPKRQAMCFLRKLNPDTPLERQPSQQRLCGAFGVECEIDQGAAIQVSSGVLKLRTAQFAPLERSQSRSNTYTRFSQCKTSSQEIRSANWEPCIEFKRFIGKKVVTARCYCCVNAVLREGAVAVLERLCDCSKGAVYSLRTPLLTRIVVCPCSATAVCPPAFLFNHSH